VTMPTDTTAAPPRTLGRCLLLASLACCAVLALTALYHFTDSSVWDDSYMFVRYADNLLEHGQLAWNPGARPTYGLTSVLYLGVVLPMRLLTRGDPALAAVASSTASAALFVLALVVLIDWHAYAGPTGRRALVLLTLFALSCAALHIGTHMASGMDTLFALAYVTVYIIAGKRFERAPSTGKALALGVLGGLAFLVRPDLMLYSACVPAALLLFGRDSAMRRLALLAGLASAVVLGAELGVARLYFGTALPLPFFAKGAGLYGPSIKAVYRWTPLVQFVQYAAYYWLPMLLVVLGLFVRDRHGERRSSPVELGLLVATVLFLVYYLGFVLQVMYMASRFYYPTLPAILFLAAQSAARLGRRLGAPSDEALARVPRAACWLGLLALLYALTPQAKLALDSIRGRKARIGRFDSADDYGTNAEWRRFWFALDRFAALPDDLVIATTEIGRPGALAPRKTIVDISGLNEPAVALRSFSPEWLLAEKRPDLIYLPHPDYAEMVAVIREHPRFAKDYEYHSAESLDATMGIALRRDSKHFDAMRKIVDDNRPREGAAGPS